MTDTTPSLPELTPETFINRELSNIEFQKRVLELAKDERLPLLERIKFVAIVGNNLDEFFMVRIASYLQKVQLGISRPRPDGLSSTQVLHLVREEVTNLFSEQRAMKHAIIRQLATYNVKLVRYHELNEEEQAILGDYFTEAIFPILTPLAADHARPFPFISNLSLNLGVFLERDNNAPQPEFARIKIPVPDILPRLFNPDKIFTEQGLASHEGYRFLWVEDIIIHNLQSLFPGMGILEACPFRVLRNADIDYEHEQDEDLLDVMSIIEQGVRERRFGSVVRVSVPNTVSERMLKRLREGLEIHPMAYIYKLDGAVGSADLFELLGVDRPDLKFPPYVPKFPDALPLGSNIFEQIKQQDILVHHPYDSFGSVEDFFRTAATDPQVLAIKATLYRVGKNSPVVQALLDARDNDKQVTVLVELKARFDEENNLLWARRLEEKGVHVIYGVEELPVKTHAKVALVVRREEGGVRRYLHLSTGNYNSSTARLYTDFGLFTCDPVLADDASRLFNRLTGYAPQTSYKKLLVAPEFVVDAFAALIDNEIQAAREGKEARMIFKMNQLEEDFMMQKLYEASQAGVKIDLLIRGLCCLRPQVAGVSENIRVISIVGRFLEHSRAYYFHNAPDEQKLYLGSADLMRRNLYNRVEVIFPILESRMRAKVLRVLEIGLADNRNAWELQSDGSYRRLEAQEGAELIDSQDLFMKHSFGLDLPS